MFTVSTLLKRGDNNIFRLHVISLPPVHISEHFSHNVDPTGHILWECVGAGYTVISSVCLE